jgi:hypothetical protein
LPATKINNCSSEAGLKSVVKQYRVEPRWVQIHPLDLHAGRAVLSATPSPGFACGSSRTECNSIPGICIRVEPHWVQLYPRDFYAGRAALSATLFPGFACWSSRAECNSIPWMCMRVEPRWVQLYPLDLLGGWIYGFLKAKYSVSDSWSCLLPGYRLLPFLADAKTRMRRFSLFHWGVLIFSKRFLRIF